jgi:circadian clock protein KaiC
MAKRKKNKYDIDISEDAFRQFTQKVSSGVDGFDVISRGGIPKGRTTLVSGTSGSGKTVFASQFLYHGATHFNEPCVFVTFEELPKDIIKNMKSFGWDLNELIRKKKWAFIDASPSVISELESGKYDLAGFLERIKYISKKIKAKRLVIDSVSALFPRYKDASIIRRELYKIGNQLKKLGITTIMTAERQMEHGPIARFGVEEFVSDNVLILHNRLTDQGDRERTIEILKYRGSGHDTSEAPLIVTNHGMEVFPRPKPELSGKGFMEKMSTGIQGIDKMLYGGVHKNSTTLLTGASGTGKTVSALHFVMEGARNGEKALFIEFEESPGQLFRNAKSFGWNLKKYVDNGTVSLICHYPEDLKPEQYLSAIEDLVSKTKPRRVVVDSLSALERIYKPEKFREFVIGLNAFLKMNNCTSLMANTTSQLLGFSQITETHLSTATDNILILKYVELAGDMRRLISVLKARGSDHEKELKEFVIGKKGIEIVGNYKNFEGLLSGAARRIKIEFDAEVDAEKEFMKQSRKGTF